MTSQLQIFTQVNHHRVCNFFFWRLWRWAGLLTPIERFINLDLFRGALNREASYGTFNLDIRLELGGYDDMIGADLRLAQKSTTILPQLENKCFCVTYVQKVGGLRTR